MSRRSLSSGLPAGIGSNDIGLDRGQLGNTRIVRFERSGPQGLAHPGESRLPRRHQRRGRTSRRSRLELLPEGADLMDLRYNVIQWVHRSTRGWSYGASITDPRTGEIIKGHVTLGSLRVRQDYLIAAGLLAPYDKGKAVSPRMLQ